MERSAKSRPWLLNELVLSWFVRFDQSSLPQSTGKEQSILPAIVSLFLIIFFFQNDIVLRLLGRLGLGIRKKNKDSVLPARHHFAEKFKLIRAAAYFPNNTSIFFNGSKLETSSPSPSKMGSKMIDFPIILNTWNQIVNDSFDLGRCRLKLPRSDETLGEIREKDRP